MVIDVTHALHKVVRSESGFTLVAMASILNELGQVQTIWRVHNLRRKSEL